PFPTRRSSDLPSNNNTRIKFLFLLSCVANCRFHLHLHLEQCNASADANLNFVPRYAKWQSFLVAILVFFHIEKTSPILTQLLVLGYLFSKTKRSSFTLLLIVLKKTIFSSPFISDIVSNADCLVKRTVSPIFIFFIFLIISSVTT